MVLWLVHFHVSGLPENSHLGSCGKLSGLSILANKTWQENINVPEHLGSCQGMLLGKGLGTDIAIGQRTAVAPQAGWTALPVPWPCSCNDQRSPSDLTPLGLTLGSPMAIESIWQRSQITPLSAASQLSFIWANGRRMTKTGPQLV